MRFIFTVLTLSLLVMVGHQTAQAKESVLDDFSKLEEVNSLNRSTIALGEAEARLAALQAKAKRLEADLAAAPNHDKAFPIRVQIANMNDDLVDANKRVRHKANEVKDLRARLKRLGINPKAFRGMAALALTAPVLDMALRAQKAVDPTVTDATAKQAGEIQTVIPLSSGKSATQDGTQAR